jgi:hypothetical protein
VLESADGLDDRRVWFDVRCYHLISHFSVGSDALESGERESERTSMGRYIR